MSKLDDRPADERQTGRGKANEALVRRLFEDVLENGELHLIDELFAPDYVGYVDRADGVWRGPDAVKRSIVDLHTAFFDPEATIDHLEEGEDSVLVHWSAAGRHEREFAGLEPTCVIGDAGTEPGGRTVTARGATLCLVWDGEIRETWTTVDVGAFLKHFADQIESVRSHLGLQAPSARAVGHDEGTDLRRRRDVGATPSPAAASETGDRNREERVDD